MAVVAMVEPEMAENTVPATTATTASRPGTSLIKRSMPSITLTASPVWNSTSPINTNKGMGVSAALDTDTTLERASCTRPGSPPRYSHAPTKLMTKKPKATGRPKKISTVEPPSNNQAASSQLMRPTPRRRAALCQHATSGACETAFQSPARQTPPAWGPATTTRG